MLAQASRDLVVIASRLRIRRKKREQETAHLRADLAAFVREAWCILEPTIELKWNWHIELICSALQEVTDGHCQRLLINIPPGLMKSMLVAVMWPAWEWLRKPAARWVFATYANDLTLRDARKARMLIDSEWYKSLIPHRFGGKRNRAWDWAPDQNAKGYYENDQKGFRYSTSVDGQATGHRGNRVVVDDPMNAKEHPTADKLTGIISWWDTTMSTRVNDQSKDAFVVIMQRLHENDLAGHLLRQDEQNKGNPAWLPYRHISLPMCFDPEQPKTSGDPRTQRGELLCPSLFTPHAVDRLRVQLGVYAFEAQEQQRPSPATGGILRVHALRFWYPDADNPPQPWTMKDAKGNTVTCLQMALPKRFDIEALSWDLAFKGEHDSDPVCGQHWARKASSLLLLSQAYGRWTFTETLEQFRAMCTRAPNAIAKYVEDKANGPAIMSMLADEIMGLVPVEPDGGKEARAHAAAPVLDAGNIYLPHPALYDWVPALIAEMASFPRGVHDDQVDALTQAVRKLAAPSGDWLEAMTKM